MKLCSSLSCSTLVKSNEFCVQAFAVLFDFSKVEQVLCLSLSLFDFTSFVFKPLLSCSTLVKSKGFCVQAFPCSTLQVLCSSLSCSTLVKSNEFCVQAFAVLFDFSKVEQVLCSSLSLFDFSKVERVLFSSLSLFDFSKVEQVLCSSLSCSTLVKSNEFCVQAFAVLFDFGKVED